MKETKGQSGYPQFDAAARQCTELKSDIKDKWWFTLAELSSNGLAFITGAGVVCVSACEELHRGLWERERDRGRERFLLVGPSMTDEFGTIGRPAAFSIKHIPLTSRSASLTHSLRRCKQRPLGTWVLCDGQKIWSWNGPRFSTTKHGCPWHVFPLKYISIHLWFWWD